MGHMAAMAAMCKFAAMHGLVKPETEEEKKERREKEAADAKREAERRKNKAEYLAFWEEQYAKISDESSIINFEYALENVNDEWLHFIYGDTWAKDVKSKIRYPDLHCEALMKTHRTVLYKHAIHLIHEAFNGKGRYARTDVSSEERNRIHKIGRVCNWWKNDGYWRGC